VAQVDSDARPGARAAAHGVDEHIVRLQERRGVGMARLPAFEAGERVVLVLRVRDGDERLRRLAPAAARPFNGAAFPPRRRDARRLVG
jgi:hypothetical protein